MILHGRLARNIALPRGRSGLHDPYWEHRVQQHREYLLRRDKLREPDLGGTGSGSLTLAVQKRTAASTRDRRQNND